MAYNYRSQEELIKSVISSIYYSIYEKIGEVEVKLYRTKEPVPFAE